MSIRETLAMGALPSTLDRTDEVSARDSPISQYKQNNDGNLGDDKACGGKIERRDIPVAIQLEHADRDRQDTFAVQEHQRKDKFLPYRDKVQRVTYDDSRNRE